MRALFVPLVVASLSALGCGGAAIGGDSPVVVGALDPLLVEEAKTVVFSFSTTKTCKDLVNLSPAQIGDALADEKPPLQILTPPSGEHVFGKVEPNVPIAYFVLASTKTDLDARVELADFKGTVFAMGCADFTAPSGTRRDLPLTLFPVGLR